MMHYNRIKSQIIHNSAKEIIYVGNGNTINQSQMGNYRTSQMNRKMRNIDPNTKEKFINRKRGCS